MKKNVLILITAALLSSCVKVETEGVAHEAGDLIRDGVKGGIQMYKESKKDTVAQKDTTTFWDKTRGTITEVKKTIKTIKE